VKRYKGEAKVLDVLTEYQTLPEICAYMAGLIPETARTVLEPTPGKGNLVRAIEARGFDCTAPGNFFDVGRAQFDSIVLNPPFSEKHAFGIPVGANLSGMKLGYHILTECLHMSNSVVALMPWFVLTDSDRRMRQFKKYGIRSITALPRRAFSYSRIQTMVIEFSKHYSGSTEFKVFDLLNPAPELKL
jgi:hypothetical protein